jgi:predicted N-acyltransferase
LTASSPTVSIAAPPRDGVRVVRSIHEVDPAEWDSVVPADELQGTHAFVAACEDSGVEDAVYRHVVVYRGGRAVGVASLACMPVALDLLSTGLARTVIGALRRLKESFLRPRMLFCGLPVSAGRPCLHWSPAADAAHVVRAVGDVMERVADEMGVRILCFKEFDAAEAALMEPLEAMGYFAAPSLPTFRMAVPWTSFDAYAAGLRAGYRRQLRASLRVRAREGLTVRTVDGPAAEWERFQALYDQVIERAQFRLERLNLAFFRNLGERLPGRVRLLLLERGDRLLAAAVLLFAPGRTTFFMTGIDYALNRRYHAYPNLVAEVVAEAIRAGAPVLELGQTSEALKSRLGALPEPRTLYLRWRSPVGHALLRRGAGALFPVVKVQPRRPFRAADGE